MHHVSFLLAVAASVATPSLSADTFRVTNTDDSGVGSLRWAIDQVNASDSADNTIRFDNTLAGQTITWGEDNPPPIIQNSVTIDGSAADNLTISGGDNHRVLFVDAAGGNVAIRDLNVSNGSATGGTGGGLLLSIAIVSTSLLIFAVACGGVRVIRHACDDWADRRTYRAAGRWRRRSLLW